MTPAQLISRKRDGEELGDNEIARFINEFVDGIIPDYQMSAFAMAVYFQGMTTRETVALTRALLESGQMLSWSDAIPKVDKHSTGGIGDKVSLVLAPIIAACGLHVPMLSGRGLGITGGTLDKLESINGFRTDLSLTELQDQTSTVGCVITGASAELAPADRKLYALRDVTGTVPSQPLIVSSILSKKLAENLSSLVLDVKSGSGAFMKTYEEASSLARLLVKVSSQLGARTTAIITDMNQPLGSAVGNAVEVQEAIDTLQGSGPADVLQLSIRLGRELLLSAKISETEEDADRLQISKIHDGSAFRKFEKMVTAQGGRLHEFKLATESTITAAQSGYLQSVDCQYLGNFLVALGGGRKRLTDTIDHSLGLHVLVRVGDQIERGQPLARVYARHGFDRDAVQAAFTIGQKQIGRRTLILDQIGDSHER